jgi:hypothetical protein
MVKQTQREDVALYNLFQPAMHLKEKVCQADKVVRRFDQTQTPYQGPLATGTLAAEQLVRSLVVV